ncbi:hypothetical protein ACOMHN_059246 [Nucella lapillus]
MEGDPSQTSTTYNNTPSPRRGGGGGGGGRGGGYPSTYTPISKSKCTRFMRALFLFQLSTQTYVTLRHLLPWFLEETGPFRLWFPHMVALYLFAVFVLNWVCVIRYSSEYTPRAISDPRHDMRMNGLAANSSLQQCSSGSNTTPMDTLYLRDSGSHVTVDITEKGGLPWGYCSRCEMDTPPRTVHCRFCRVCVLRRDHHCHLVGCCIGHWNQRFFVAMAANGMVVGCLGAYLTLGYLYYHHSSEETLWNYFLPVAVVKWLCGSISGLQAVLTFHAYMLCTFAPIGGHYFAIQTCLIASGKTRNGR